MYSHSLKRWREGERFVPSVRNLSLHDPKQGAVKLTRFENDDFGSTAPEKWTIIKEALLLTDSLELVFGDEPDLQFISSVVKESDRLRKITISFQGANIDYLIYRWERSGLDQAEIDRRVAEETKNSEIRKANIMEFMVLLQHSKTLRKIRLSYSSGFKDLKFYSALQNPHLESISLHSIPADMWRTLVPILSNRPLLKAIEISGVLGASYGSPYLAPFCTILIANPALEKLRISIAEQQEISEYDIERILSALERRPKNSSSTSSDVLTHPNSQYVKTKPSLILSGYLYSEALPVLTSAYLKHLDLSYCNIPNMSCFAVGLPYCVIKSLKLNLSENTYDSFVELVNGLVSSSIEKLDLSYSRITDEMCAPEVLGKLFTEMYSLKILILSHNNIGNDGFRSICTALNAMLVYYNFEELQLHGNWYDANAIYNYLVNADEVPTRHLKRLTIDCSAMQCEYVFNVLRYPDLQWALIGRRGMYDGCEVTNLSFDEEQNADVFKKLLKENKRFKSEVQFPMAIISHYIARSNRNEVFILPKELWIKILCEVYTNVELNKLVESIFDLYKQKK